MTAAKKATIYIDSKLHKAVRIKAAAEDLSVSDLVNEALKNLLLEDAEDLADSEKRTKGPFVAYDQVIKNLKKDGIL